MKTVIVSIALLFLATGALAQNYVTVSVAAAYNECFYYDDIEGPVDFYILHMGGEAAGVRFRLQATPGMTMTYVSEEHVQPVLSGDTQNGIVFCYGSCKALGGLVLAKVTYMNYGTSTFCSEIRVVPYPGSNTIDELVCGGGVLYANGGQLKVDPNINCGGCNDMRYYGPPEDPYDFCAPVSTEHSTWGAIKGLYR